MVKQVKQSLEVTDNFIEYMTGLGYVLASNRQLFYPWNNTLEERRADINVNEGRSVTLQEGVGWNGDNWQIDLISRNNILSVVTAINAGLWDSEYVTWRNTANEDEINISFKSGALLIYISNS